MFLLFMVLDDPARLSEVLVAWEGAGVRGATILESTGLQRVFERQRPDAVQVVPDVSARGMVGHRTLFAVVADLEMAEAAMRRAEAVIGDLTEPNTGIAFLVPVLAAWGLPQL